jgi:hypothetical protein
MSYLVEKDNVFTSWDLPDDVVADREKTDTATKKQRALEDVVFGTREWQDGAVLKAQDINKLLWALRALAEAVKGLQK